MRKHRSTIVLALVFIIGLCLLLYPSFSDWWNSFHQTQAIASYAQAVAQINDTDYDALWGAAQQYNKSLLQKQNRYHPTEEEHAEYQSILNISGTGVIGYVEIPEIAVSLPIYHGTDEAVLQVATGHIEGSSFPSGEIGTHCAISGHRGLPSAKLFTNLDKLKLGDVFILQVLNETITYEVDQILIVYPYELEALDIDETESYCTLVTCTPYGINSHRLLVRGHRVENQAQAKNVRVVADAIRIQPILATPVFALPMISILLLVMLATTRKKHKRNRTKKKKRIDN